MSDRKLTKGNHYSCQHQELGKSSCDTCNRGAGGSIDIKGLSCSKCKKSLGRTLKTSTFHGTETKHEVELDCYQNNEKLHTCVGCHEKDKDNNQERETNPTITNSNCWIRSNY